LVKNNFMTKSKFNGGQLSLIEDNIIYIQFDDELIVEKSHIDNLRISRIELIGSVKKFHAIIDLTNEVKLSLDAKSYIAHTEVDVRICDVIITNTNKHDIEAYLYKKFERPKNQVVFKKNLEEAITCIKDFEDNFQKKTE